MPTTLAGHPYWETEDEKERAQQRIHFLKNLTMLGGLLIAAADTEGNPSLAWRSRHAVQAARHDVSLATQTAKASGKAGVAVGTTLGKAQGTADLAQAKADLARARAGQIRAERTGEVRAKAGKVAHKASIKAAKAAGKASAKAAKAATKASVKASRDHGQGGREGRAGPGQGGPARLPPARRLTARPPRARSDDIVMTWSSAESLGEPDEVGFGSPRPPRRRWPRWPLILAGAGAAVIAVAAVLTLGRHPVKLASAQSQVTVTDAGHRLLGVRAGWELLGYGPGRVVRVQPAQGRVTQTVVPAAGQHRRRSRS